MTDGLGWRESDAELLDFERRWWTHLGPKETSIRERLGLSSAAYYRRLSEIVDLPQAMAHDPQLVRRLRRQRSSRQQLRSMRRSLPGSG